MIESIPEGFEPWPPTSPFMKHVAGLGALYRRARDHALAVRVGEPHANTLGIAHGGLLATLADCALGQCIAHQERLSVVTVQMSLDYMSAVKSGDWLEAHVRIDKKGRRLIYATCLLQVGGKTVLKANAVFAVRKADATMSDG